MFCPLDSLRGFSSVPRLSARNLSVQMVLLCTSSHKDLSSCFFFVLLTHKYTLGLLRSITVSFLVRSDPLFACGNTTAPQQSKQTKTAEILLSRLITFTGIVNLNRGRPCLMELSPLPPVRTPWRTPFGLFWSHHPNLSWRGCSNLDLKRGIENSN